MRDWPSHNSSESNELTPEAVNLELAKAIEAKNSEQIAAIIQKMIDRGIKFRLTATIEQDQSNLESPSRQEISESGVE